MELSAQEVQHLATLARIEMSDDEVEAFRGEATAILGYVDRLREVDTSGVEPHTAPAVSDTWRRDIPHLDNVGERAAILVGFPEREGELLRTPSIFLNPKKERQTE